MLALLRSVLAREQYDVVASGKPFEALELAQKLGARLALLITDLNMPVMNGRELFERMRGDHPELRVLFISGYPDQVVSMHDMVGTGFQLLQKPFSIDALKSKVSEVLSKPAKPV